MNNKMLISTAMLNAYWEREKKDTLDLLIPFIKYSIAKTTTVGSVIDIPKMSQHFKEEFGYDTIPANVITLILNRLTPSILTKNKGEYRLETSLDDAMNNFEKGHAQFVEHCSKVAITLKDFLNEKALRYKYNEEQALQELIAFFATNGLCVIKDTALLEMLKKKDDAIKYEIAQFILRENDKKSEVFNYIVDIVKGFFVSTVISLQPQNATVSQSKFKGLKCYIDTRVIIDALGLRLPEAKVAAQELISMLREKGADLYCFEHNYQEIEDIIAAYKHDLKYPHHSHPYQTLESWDAQEYTVTDVERYQTILKDKIRALGINVVAKPFIEDISKYPFNHSEIAAFIKEHMNYNKKEALEIDIDSIASVLLLKEGNTASEIEKSGAIFVTSNIHLANVVNIFLKVQNICDPETQAMPIITDMDLSSILWLKCYATHKDYPVQRLIEHAMIALEPSHSMLKTFFDIVDRIQAEGGITEDEAAIIRSDAFCRKELSSVARGDVDNITDQTVYDIKDSLKKRYIGDADEKSELNYQKYQQEKEKKRTIIINALKQVKEYREKSYNKIYKFLFRLSCLIVIAVACSFIILSIIDIGKNEYLTVKIILLLFGSAGTIDMLYSKMNLIKRLISKIANNFADKQSDKKKIEYENILGDIKYDISE